MTEYCCKKHWLEKRVKGLEDQLAELKTANKMWEIITLMPHAGIGLYEALENAIDFAARHQKASVGLIFNGIPISVQEYDGEVATLVMSADMLTEKYKEQIRKRRGF